MLALIRLHLRCLETAFAGVLAAVVFLALCVLGAVAAEAGGAPPPPPHVLGAARGVVGAVAMLLLPVLPAVAFSASDVLARLAPVRPLRRAAARWAVVAQVAVGAGILSALICHPWRETGGATIAEHAAALAALAFVVGMLLSMCRSLQGLPAWAVLCGCLALAAGGFCAALFLASGSTGGLAALGAGLALTGLLLVLVDLSRERRPAVGAPAGDAVRATPALAVSERSGTFELLPAADVPAGSPPRRAALASSVGQPAPPRLRLPLLARLPSLTLLRAAYLGRENLGQLELVFFWPWAGFFAWLWVQLLARGGAPAYAAWFAFLSYVPIAILLSAGDAWGRALRAWGPFTVSPFPRGRAFWILAWPAVVGGAAIAALSVAAVSWDPATGAETVHVLATQSAVALAFRKTGWGGPARSVRSLAGLCLLYLVLLIGWLWWVGAACLRPAEFAVAASSPVAAGLPVLACALLAGASWLGFAGLTLDRIPTGLPLRDLLGLARPSRGG